MSEPTYAKCPHCGEDIYKVWRNEKHYVTFHAPSLEELIGAEIIDTSDVRASLSDGDEEMIEADAFKCENCDNELPTEFWVELCNKINGRA